MGPPASCAFGKLRRTDQSVDWHPLIDHMADVAAVLETLCYTDAIQRALEALAGRAMNQQDIARLSAIAFLHDIGKANNGFQAKRWLKDERPRGWVTAGHGVEALAMLMADDEAARALQSQLPLLEIAEWGEEAASNLLLASLAHHGRPLDSRLSWWDAKIYWMQKGGYDPGRQLGLIGDAVQRFVPAAFELGGEALPGSPRFVHFFAGLIQLADWLGSDTRFFKFSEEGEDRLQRARELARCAVQHIGLNISTSRTRLTAGFPVFSVVFGTQTPYPTQTAMADRSLGQVVVLEAETGSGKTEAAVWRFLHLLEQGQVDSLYFALPTRVAATQVYQRICTALENTWPVDPPLAVRALSGYAMADGEFAKALPDFQVQWSDEPSDAQASRRWAAESAKRFLAAPVAVGTVDQLLLGTLQVRHAHLRHCLAARSLLVIDEVHASDAYMGVLIQHLIKAQVALGGHILLLSATLGATARARYLAAGRVKRGTPVLPSLAQAMATPYPAISDERGLRATSGAQRSKTVLWRCADWIDKPESIASAALTAAAQGAKVLIIRNTVPAAVATLAALEAATPNSSCLFQLNNVVTLHHSRFSREDRPLMDDAVQQQIGKIRPKGALILIGTQTLEQSLDIDADYLITDLCPMDVLLQRIGRLHRHSRSADERPTAFQTAQTLILTPNGGDLSPHLKRARHGLGRLYEGGGVYPDLRILEATRELIESIPQIHIPADNRRLVDSATHPEALERVQQRNEEWAQHGQKVDGDTSARQTLAKLGLLQLDCTFQDCSFQDDAKIATRLGAADRLIRFDPSLPGPFGNSVSELPIRHHMVPPALPLEELPQEIITFPGGFDFVLGAARYSYSRIGLEHIRETTNTKSKPEQ